MKYLEKGSTYIIYICGALLFISVFFIALEVILRKFFLFSFGGVDEISSYILAISTSWSLAYVLFEKMHIRIDLFYNKVKSKTKYIFDFIAMLSTFIFIGIIVYFSIDVFSISFLKSAAANTPLGAPLWIPQFLWSAGFMYFLIVILMFLFQSIKNIFSNEKNTYGTIDKEEEC